MDKKTMLKTIETADLMAVEGGASLDLTSVFSKVKVKTTEYHDAFANVSGNKLGAGSSITVAQIVS